MPSEKKNRNYGLFGHAGDQEVWDGMDEGTLSKTKEMLDDMHKRKIDMADEIYVINVGGYIGDSTRSEIQYAEEHGKPVRYYQNTSREKGLASRTSDVNGKFWTVSGSWREKKMPNMCRKSIGKS